MNITNESSLQDVKNYLNENYVEGCNCPACDQRVQMYKRKLSSTMAYCLILFAVHQRQNQNVYTKFSNILDDLNITPTQRADWQKLVYFKLIKPDPDAKTLYKITDSGRLFIEGKKNMPEYANVLNGKVYGFAMDQINITQALRNKFNLDDLLDGI